MNSANTMPTPAWAANSALSTEVQSRKRSGCEGPAGLAWISRAGWASVIGSTPEASSSQADNRAKYCGKASEPDDRSAPPVRWSVPRARPTPRSMRPGARASSSMNTSATFSGE